MSVPCLSEAGRHSPPSLFSCLRGLRPLPVPIVNSGTFTPVSGPQPRNAFEPDRITVSLSVVVGVTVLDAVDGPLEVTADLDRPGGHRDGHSAGLDPHRGC